MQLNEYTLTAPAVSTNSIALAQTLGAAGNLTLNGATVVNGVAVLGTKFMVPVTLTFAANETGHNFTIYGTDYGGNAISEVIAGTTAGTVNAVNDYATVTRIAVSAATTGNVSAGNLNQAIGRWIVCDKNKANFQVGFGCTVTGSVVYSVEHTWDDVLSQPTSAANQKIFFNDEVVNETVSMDSNYAYNIAAFRLVIVSGTGSVEIQSLEAGAGPGF